MRAWAGRRARAIAGASRASAHALAYALKAVKLGHYEPGARILINCSGRGDKDLDTYRKLYGHRIGGADAKKETHS